MPYQKQQIMTANNKSIWAIDPGHTQVQFRIKHLGIANVNGTFDSFRGTLQTDNDTFDHSNVHFEIDAASINTKLEARDQHLKSAFLFNTEQYPTITFEGMLEKKDHDYQLTGELTICTVTRHIVLDASFTGSQKGPRGDTRAGFEVDGKINRKDFGLTWNILTEAGGIVVGDEVKLRFDIELIRQEDKS